MNDKKMTILLSSLVIILISIIISYPVVKLYENEKKYNNFIEQINNISLEINKLYKSNKFNNKQQIFTIKNYNILEEGLILESKLPKDGLIYVNNKGQVKIIANNYNYCILKDYDNNIYSNQCESLNTVKFGNLDLELVYEGDGIYSNFNGEYYYKGDNPNNYIKINDELYRIIKINQDNNIVLIKNDYFEIKKSENLYDLLNNVNNSIEYKKYRTNNFFNESQYFTYNYEDNEKELSTNMISFLNIQDYINVSLDTKCKNNIKNIKYCKNNNWLNTGYPYISRDFDGQGLIEISSKGMLKTADLDSNFNTRFVFTMNINYKFKGIGTFKNPYIIVI